MAAGFEQNGSSGGQQPIHQLVHVFLEERLPAGDLDEATSIPLGFRHHIVHRHLAALVECVRRIAPRTAKVAGSEPDEHTRAAGVRRLALNRIEDLVDGQHFLHRVGPHRNFHYPTLMAKPIFYWKPT